MIKVMTSSCARDLAYVTRLNEQLVSHKIKHYIFVEQHEKQLFSHLNNVLIKPDGGDNGGGRDGTMVRWACYQQMIQILGNDDTFLQLDSDVMLNNEALYTELVCEHGQIKGFFDDSYSLTAYDKLFRHMSGMLIAASADVFKKATESTRNEMYSICTRVLNAGICPSEDVMLSYLLQIRGGGNIINMSDKFTRNLGKEYKGNYDVEC